MMVGSLYLPTPPRQLDELAKKHQPDSYNAVPFQFLEIARYKSKQVVNDQAILPETAMNILMTLYI